MINAFLFLFTSVLGLFSLLLILRFYSQWVSTPYGHPITSFIFTLTNPVVMPLRKIVPGLFGYEIVSIVLAWIIELVLLLGTRLILDLPISPSLPIAFLAVLSIVKTTIYILLVTVLIQALLSWINPFNPLMGILQSITAPFLGIFQKYLPPISGIDLSPLVFVFVCQLILIWPVGAVESLLISSL